MKLKILNTVILATWFTFGASTVFAQTQMSGPQGSVPLPPVPTSVVNQAKSQANGTFPVMLRSKAGGQIQEAWNEVNSKAGVVNIDFCGLCSYKIRLREHMITLIELPRGETIERIDNGDAKVFTVNMRGTQRFAVQAVGYGVDTNLIVYGKSGNVYPFYVRVERFNSNNISDQFVKINGGRITKEEFVGDTIGGNVKGLTPDLQSNAEADQAFKDLATKQDPKQALYDGLAPPLNAPKENGFLQNIPFDPDNLRGWGDYKIWGGGDNSEMMKPETVFRDDHFTYIRFGAKWKDIELPTGYVVIDSVDELVNTRVQGTTFIIESTNRLITLKSGQSFICIEYTGEML